MLGMSVASFCEELWIRRSLSSLTIVALESASHPSLLCRNAIRHLGWPACSTSFSSGNQVDGLPLVANTVLPEGYTGEDSIGPEPHVIMYGRATFDRSQLVIAPIICARAKI